MAQPVAPKPPNAADIKAKGIAWVSTRPAYPHGASRRKVRAQRNS